MSIDSLKQFQDIFAAVGVEQIFIKRLAKKQDNQKNQIVLASQFDGLANVFPAREISVRAASESRKKRKSAAGRPIVSAELDFWWLDGGGGKFRAPETKLIDYFQYPETRLSGFLKSAKWAPEGIRRDRQAKFGARILGIGFNRAGETYGLLISERDDPLARDFPVLPASGISGVLQSLDSGKGVGTTPAELLAIELRDIVSTGWHTSIRNKGGTIVPFKGNQGAGYTLEALLGVETNANKEPDAHGHEIKSFRGDKISLMTPTADLGFEGTNSFRDFMRAYGKDGKKGDGSKRFTGVHRVGSVNKGTGLGLRVIGYNPAMDQFDEDPNAIRVELYAPASGEVVSGWSLSKLAGSWSRKHAFAAYVRAEHRENKSDSSDEYRFQVPWYMCEGTDIWKLFKAISSGLVYYDPVHSIYADGEAKVRPQWRIGTGKIHAALEKLYNNVREVS